MLPPIAVQPWPGPLAFDAQGILVLGLELAPTPPRAADARPQARLALRQALAQALAMLLQRPLADIRINNQRGQPPQIQLAGACVSRSASAPHCSFAYSENYALAAVSLHGPIGVDLAPVLELPDWQAVARDYLGPQVCARLQAMPATQRPRALAQAWSQLEAQLKCCAEPLTEWQGTRDDASLQTSPPSTMQASLLLPQPELVGHVVWRQNATT